MLSDKPSISVVIPTRNRPDDLARAVKSVLAQTYRASELLIIDQSTSKKSKQVALPLLEIAPELKVQYVLNPQISGLTAAKNVAIKLATGDVLLFIDDDIILEPNFLEALIWAYRESDLDGIGGVLKSDPHRANFYHFISLLFRIGPFRDDRLILQHSSARSPIIHRTWLLSGGLSSFKRHVFDEFLFNEALLGASPVEDVDFFSRASKRFRFGLAPAARAVHNVSMVMRLNSQDFFTAKCQVYGLYFQKYVDKSAANYLAYLWINVGLFLDALAKSLASRSVGPVVGVLEGWRRVMGVVREGQILSAR